MRVLGGGAKISELYEVVLELSLACESCLGRDAWGRSLLLVATPREDLIG